MRFARFEVVRTAAGWHARFRASNGRIVWTTEVYRRRRAAEAAIQHLTWEIGGYWGTDLETRVLDERTGS